VGLSPDLGYDQASAIDATSAGAGADGAGADGAGAGLTALGRHTEYRYDRPDPTVLEAFNNPYPGSPWVVSLWCNEFTSLCPVTGQPDYGRLIVDYVPGRLCVESKSLKLYLVGFRNHGSFHEACVNQVADDLAAKLSPRYLRVYGDFNPRGGIAIRPLAVRYAADLSEGELAQCLSLLSQVGAYSPTSGDPHTR
jgi:7-cyano-7-deazaguanine reductase